MTVPAHLVAALPAGEAVIGAMKSAATYAFPAIGGSSTAPLWIVVASRRCWLIAVRDGEIARFARGRLGDFGVERRTVGRHRFRLGPWTIPILRRDADTLTTWLVKLARSGGGDADVDEEPTATGELRGTAAIKVPRWVVEDLPSPPDTHWLQVLTTATSVTFTDMDGSAVSRPVCVAVADVTVIAAARGPRGQLVSQPVKQPLTLRHRTTWDQLVAEDLPTPVEVALGQRSEAARLVALATASEPEERWRMAGVHCLPHSPDEAARVWGEAIGHGLAARSLTELAWVLARAGQATGATRVAAHALAQTPALAPTDGAQHFAALDTLSKGRHPTSAHLQPLEVWAASLDPVEPPQDLPWPPSSDGAIWSAAALALQRGDEAIDAFPQAGPDKPVDLLGCAVTMAAAGAHAAAAFRHAAEALRPTEPALARLALTRAAQAEPDHLASLWRLGAWCSLDAEHEEATHWWHRALILDPTGAALPALPLDAPGWTTIAVQAEEEACWEAAALARRAAIEADPGRWRAWQDLVDLLEGPMDQPSAAAQALESALALETDHEGARWDAWARVAALHGSAGRKAQAGAALGASLREAYLHPEAYEAALAVGDATCGDVFPWWQHMHRLLAGPSVAEGRPRPPATLDAAMLDALHPGGAGWLDRARHLLDNTEPPERKVLVRGLDHIETGGTEGARVAAIVERLSGAIGIEPPPTYLFRGDGSWGASAWPTKPPVLLVGQLNLAPGPRHLDDRALSFLLAVELVHLACDHPLLAFEHGLVGTSRSVYQAFGRYAGAAESAVDILTLLPGVDQLAKLQTIVSLARKVFTTRSVIDKASDLANPVMNRLGIGNSGGPAVGREGLQGAALQFRIQADRAALRLVGDLRAATRAILRSSSHSLEAAAAVEDNGLAAVLGDSSRYGLQADEALRLTALVRDALDLEPPARAPNM